MYPGSMHWWRTRRAEACGTASHCGEGRGSHGGGAWSFSWSAAIAAGTFDAEKARQAATLRVTGAERLRDAVVKALGQLHAMLTPEQRNLLAYLIRTGAILF